MRTYALAIGLIVFGSICACINDASVFSVALPEHTDGSMTGADVRELTGGATAEDVSALQPVSSLLSLSRILFVGLITALTVAPLLLSLGFPAWTVGMIQAPIWFVYAWGLIQFITARPSKTMD